MPRTTGARANDLQRSRELAGFLGTASEAQTQRQRILLSDPRICLAVAGLDAVTLFSSAMAVWFFYHLGKGSDFADWPVYLTTSLVFPAVFVVMALSGRAYNFIGELRKPEAVAESLKCFLVTFAAYVTLLFFFRYGATFSRATLAGQFFVCGSLLVSRAGAGVQVLAIAGAARQLADLPHRIDRRIRCHQPLPDQSGGGQARC